jgi:hypothetical protein
VWIVTPDMRCKPMAKYNAENERIKREYLTYLKAAKSLSEASLDE